MSFPVKPGRAERRRRRSGCCRTGRDAFRRAGRAGLLRATGFLAAFGAAFFCVTFADCAARFAAFRAAFLAFFAAFFAFLPFFFAAMWLTPAPSRSRPLSYGRPSGPPLQGRASR